MKAAIWTKYGPPEVLQVQEVDKPVPKPNEILIKIRASTVTAGDTEARALKFPFWLSLPMRMFIGVRKPFRVRTLGMELAGEVEAVGKDVTAFKPGDAVFGTSGFTFGGNAEYLCLPEASEDSLLLHKPEAISFEEAAAAPNGGLEALHFLRAGGIEAGQQVCINGAGGSIGTAAVQLAKFFGAEVTAVDRGEKLDMLRQIGADHVIDFTRADYSRGERKYDIVMDVPLGTSFSKGIRALKPDGRLMVANPRLWKFLRALWVRRTTNKQVHFAFASRTRDDLQFIAERMLAGDLKTVIGKSFPLDQIVEAHRYAESGQKLGNVVITVSHAESKDS